MNRLVLNEYNFSSDFVGLCEGITNKELDSVTKATLLEGFQQEKQLNSMRK